jgi:predicted regulator of Ras-like GTPase activity (Roadblock/LC7/MglB family)
MYKLTYRWGHPLFIVAMLAFIAASIAPGRLHQLYNVPEFQKELPIPVIIAAWLVVSIGVAMATKAAGVQKIKIGITILSMMAILAALSNMFSTDPWWLMSEGVLRFNVIELGAALVGGLVTSWALCNVQQEQSTVLREHGHRSAAGAEEPAAAAVGAAAEPQAAPPGPQAEVQPPLPTPTPSVQPAEEPEPGDTPRITRESRVPPTSTVTGLKAMSSGLGHSGLAARAAASGSSTNLKGLLDKLDPEVKLTIPPDSGADETASPAAPPSPTPAASAAPASSTSDKPATASPAAPLAEPISQLSSASASPTAEIVNPTPSDPTATAANLPAEKKPPATTTATRLQAQKRKSTATFTKLQALSAGGGGGTSAPRPKQSDHDQESDSLKSILDRLDTQPFDDEPVNDILSPVESLLTPPEVLEANRVAPPVAKQAEQAKPIEPPRTQIKPEFAKQAAKSQEPTKSAKKEQAKTPEPGKKPEPAKPAAAKTEPPKMPAKPEPVKADTQKPEPTKPPVTPAKKAETPQPSKAAHLPNDDETNLSAMLDNLESLLPEAAETRETTDFSPPAASETPAASDSESVYNKDDLLAIPTPKAKPGLRELASKEANKSKPSLIKGKAADAAKSEATGDTGEKPEPEKSEAAEAKAEPEKAEAAEAKAEPEKAEAAEAKAEPEKAEAAEAKAEPEVEAAEAKAEPEKAEAAEAKAEPEKAEAAEAKAEPEKSEAAEAKAAEPEKSEGAEAKAEPEKSEAAEAKAEPEKSQAAEAKAEPEKSQAAEAKAAEPEKSEGAEAKAEPEKSDAAEAKAEPTSENKAAEEAKAEPEKEQQKEETAKVSIGDAFAPEPASDEESALIAEAAGILANQEKTQDVSAETEAKAEPTESKTESAAPETKADATPEPAEAQTESIPESKADDKAPEAKSEEPEQKSETPEQKAEAPEQKSEAPEQKAEAPEQKVEAPEPKAEPPEQKAEAPEQKSEAPEQKPEAPEQKSEAPEQKPEAPEQKSEAPEQKPEAPEQKSEASEQKAEAVAETKPEAEEKQETPAAEIKPEPAQDKAETESKPEPADEPSKPVAEVAQSESEPKAETKSEPIPEPAEAATKAEPAPQIAPVEDNLFGAKVDQDIDDIFSAIAPPDAQKEVQAKLEFAVESQEKTISDSFIEIERSETVPDASENVFGQAIDKDIDEIFDNIVPVEAQKEVKDTGYQKPYGADTQEKQETAQTKPAEPAAAESKPEPVAPTAEAKPAEPEPVTPKPVAATSAAEIAAALKAQSDTIPPVAPVEISGSSGLFEPQKIEKDLDDIFSNIAPEEAHQTVSDQTLAKLKQSEDSDMSFEPPKSREERIAEAAKQPPPAVKFNETLARLPSMQGTVEGLLNNLADMADTDFKPGAKKSEEGPAPKSESDATQSKAVATSSVHDLLESLEQENKEHAAQTGGESVPAKSEPEPTAPSIPTLQPESESESINAALEAAQNDQTTAQQPASVASASTEMSSEDIMVKAEEEAAKQQQQAETDQESEEGELEEGDVPLSMRSTVDIATALKDAQKAKQMAAVEKQLKEFGRLSTKAPTPSNEPPGSMKTIGKLLIEVSQIENIIKAGETGKIGSNLTTARVISAARGAGIKELLNKIDSYSGVKGSVIVGHDGLVIASTVGEDMDKDALGALSLHCLGSSNMATQKLEIGKLRQMVLISGEKITVLTDVDVGILAVFMDNTRVDRIDGLITAIHETIHG